MVMTSSTDISPRNADYHVIIPLSLACILVAIIISCLILSLVIFIKKLHTVTHLLICNGSVASIFYCIVQCINYVFLAFIPWNTNDVSCRWRGFFGYMTVAAVVYSYLAQAISRLFVSVFSIKHRWATSFKIHIILICIQWIIIVFIPLPALLTKDIIYRPFSLCWVPKNCPLHLTYTIIAYYLLPALFIFAIYIYIYLRVKRRGNSMFVITRRHRSNRDLEVLYNIMILFAIYVFGAVPTILHIITQIEIFYAVGIVSVSLTVAVEKSVTLLIDRDMRNIIKHYFHPSMTQVRPLTTSNFA
jgi:hypothetical protein